MPLLHDGLVFTFMYDESKYNDRQNKREGKGEAEEAKEFELFRQEELQKKHAKRTEEACKKQQTDFIRYEQEQDKHHKLACEAAGKHVRVACIPRAVRVGVTQKPEVAGPPRSESGVESTSECAQLYD